MGPRKKVDVAKIPAWSHVEILPPYKVTVREELPRGRRLYLWWRAGGNWKKRALSEERIHGRLLRNERGEIDADILRWAIEQAKRKCLELAGDPSAVTLGATTEVARPLTIGETKAVLVDPDHGPYPHDSAYRRELLRELAYAERAWGKDTAWAAIDDDALMRLWRRRLTELVESGKTGVRGTEVTMQRILTIAAVLRQKRRIPLSAALAPEDWRDQVVRYWKGLTHSARDPQPRRPRHTQEELRKILKASAEVDPRLELLLALGAELRLGQVRRCMRSDLDLAAGTLTVPGSGDKRGTTMDLTPGQRAIAVRELAGTLAPLEARYQAGELQDYPLFPAGRLMRWRQSKGSVLGPGMRLTRPVSREWVIKNFHLAEDKAEVKRISGRAAYGLRRVAVDEVITAGLSLSGLQAHGGWTNVKIPMDIYREQENRAGRAEAARHRAELRGEQAEAPATETADQQEGDEEGSAS